MALDVNIKDAVSGTLGIAGSGDDMAKVIPETDALANPANVGDIRIFSEVDQGYTLVTPSLLSPEADADFRLRVSQDLLLEEENFSYTAQNTGKYGAAATTQTLSYAAGNATLNASAIVTTTTGSNIFSYAFFPMDGASTLSLDTELAFTAQPNANTFVEFGLGIVGASTVAPTDGVFFRLSSSGLQGIASSNGTETSTGVFTGPAGVGTWAYTNNTKYQFICYQSAVEALFWVNDGTRTHLLGRIAKPVGQQRMTMSSSGQWFVKQRITGGAGGAALQVLVGAISVRQGGQNNVSTITVAGNRKYGSYQGLSGGTMGSLANYANSANPTAAVPTNTTAALGTGLGGQFWETVSLAVNTDGIIDSYQVPAGTVNITGRRLVIRGVGLTSYVQTVLVGGPYVAQYSLAFGHTAVSLATAEASSSKAPRRIALANLTQVVTAAQAVSTMISQPGGAYTDFGDAPVFVNPGEFVALVTKHVGTVGTSGTVAHVVTFVYGWE